MEKRPTSGQWRYYYSYKVVHNSNNAIIGASSLICHVIDPIDRNEREVDANGTLLAASKDLLEALEGLLPLADAAYRNHSRECGQEEFLQEYRSDLRRAREAINKAKGL